MEYAPVSPAPKHQATLTILKADKLVLEATNLTEHVENLNACFSGSIIKMTKKSEETMDVYHKWCRGDIREQVDGNPPSNEHGCRQAGEALAAPAAGGVGPGVVANNYPSLLEAPKTVLQVATEALSGETNGWSMRK